MRGKFSKIKFFVFLKSYGYLYFVFKSISSLSFFLFVFFNLLLHLEILQFEPKFWLLDEQYPTIA